MVLITRVWCVCAVRSRGGTGGFTTCTEPWTLCARLDWTDCSGGNFGIVFFYVVTDSFSTVNIVNVTLADGDCFISVESLLNH